MGVCKAGYSIKDEAPIFLIVFAVPAAAASALYSIRSVPRLYDLYSSNPQPTHANVGPWNTQSSRPLPSHTSMTRISMGRTAASARTPPVSRLRNCASISAIMFHCERSKIDYAASAAAHGKSSSHSWHRTKEPATSSISFAGCLENRLIGIDPFRTSVCPFLIEGVRCGICQCRGESFTAFEGHPTPLECPTPSRRSAGLFVPCTL